MDDDWLAVVGAQRLVVITRDKRIRYRPVERRMWVDHRVRGFVLTGTTSQSTEDSLTVLGAPLDSHGADRGLGARRPMDVRGHPSRAARSSAC